MEEERTQSGAVLEGSRVVGLEGGFLAAVEADAEGDGRVGARGGAEVEGGAARCSRGGVVRRGVVGRSSGVSGGGSCCCVTGTCCRGGPAAARIGARVRGCSCRRSSGSGTVVGSCAASISTGTSVRTSSTSATSCSGDLVSSSIVLDEVLREDAALSVVGVVARVALRRRVSDLAGGKGATLQRVLGIAADAGDLLGQREHNGLVGSSRAVGSRVLVLADGCNLRVGRLDGRAGVGLKTDRARVALQRTVDQSGRHAGHVIGGFGVGEGLVSRGLLQTFRVGDAARALGGCSVALFDDELRPRCFDVWLTKSPNTGSLI